MNTENFNLKPCPNCKSMALEAHYTGLKGWKISCKVCGYFYNPWPFYNLTKTVETWNKIDRSIE